MLMLHWVERNLEVIFVLFGPLLLERVPWLGNYDSIRILLRSANVNCYTFGQMQPIHFAGGICSEIIWMNKGILITAKNDCYRNCDSGDAKLMLCFI